jgi:hypothetical protein
MNYIHVTILLLIISTSVILITGVVYMGFGSKDSERFRNRLMMARIIFQLLTISILIIALIIFYNK